MAKSSQPAKSGNAKGVRSVPAARRATPMAAGKPARSETRTAATAAPARHDSRKPRGKDAEALLQLPSAAAPAAREPAPAESADGPIAKSTTGQPAPAESALAEPTMMQPASAESTVGEPPADVPATGAEPPPAEASSVEEPPAPTRHVAALPEPLAVAAELGFATAALPWPGRGLIEGGIRIRSEAIAFTWRETEHAFAHGSAILATHSLPEFLALQTAYVGETLERTLAHTLELARLSSDMLRAGLPLPRAD